MTITLASLRVARWMLGYRDQVSAEVRDAVAQLAAAATNKLQTGLHISEFEPLREP